MGYQGQIAIIPFGKGGLFTDAPQTDILPLKLIRANNLTLVNECAEKDFGSRRWNESALPAGISHFHDWWPDEGTQRMIVIAKDGKVYRFTSQSAVAEVTGGVSLNTSNYMHTVSGGGEETGNAKKLFIFNGVNPVQVISGDGTTRAAISAPAADWSGTNQPFFAIPYRNKLFAFGNLNDPHRVYSSDSLDHETFTGSGSNSYSIYPGEGEKLVFGFVFRSRLWVLKYPSGLYYLDDSADSANDWFFTKSFDTLGAAGPHAGCGVLDDFLVGNQYGSLSSLSATNQFGDVQFGDVFNILKMQNFARNELARGGSNDRYAIFFEDKQQLYVSFRTTASELNNRICCISFKERTEPQVSWNTKDQPNCLALVKDYQGVKGPFYGAEDGYLYQMDQHDRWVGTSDETVRTGYTFDVQTAHMDLRVNDQAHAQANKIFDHLECVFEPTGDWLLYVDVFIDGTFVKTESFNMLGGATLGSFRLNETRLDGRIPMSQIVPLKGMGRRISLRAYNENAGENVKLLEFRIYYRTSGQQQAKAKG